VEAKDAMQCLRSSGRTDVNARPGVTRIRNQPADARELFEECHKFRSEERIEDLVRSVPAHLRRLGLYYPVPTVNLEIEGSLELLSLCRGDHFRIQQVVENQVWPWPRSQVRLMVSAREERELCEGNRWAVSRL
jgi:hypothetical protein